ncbi:MAG: PAAR domain-containing protein, partial [Desulfamplus sp.]|nr:PAAR domain-containing protein [Desulfamplus sp.]
MIVPSGVIGPPLSGPCPMKPVLIEGLPAAHVNCTAICSGAISAGLVHPPPPVPPPIVKGSMTVLIHGLPAARWAPSGDMAACGAFLGDPKLTATRTVFIGDMSGSVSPQANALINAAKGGDSFCPIIDSPKKLQKKSTDSETTSTEEINSSTSPQVNAMGDSAAPQAGALIKAAEHGKPFCEICHRLAKEGRENAKTAAKKAEEEAQKGPKINFESKIESQEGYTDAKPQTSVEIGYKVEQKIYDNQALYYGNENANVKIGHVEASAGFGYGYDVEKDEHKYTLGELKGKVSVVEAEAKGKAAKGLLEGEVKGE